jgi:hypothetical protein
MSANSPVNLTLQQVQPTLSSVPLRLRPGLRYVEGRFELILRRINYLDTIFLGFRHTDPFDLIDWEQFDLERQILEARGDLSWSKMRVLNVGFDLIQEIALQEGRDFDFDSPRELFIAMLKEQFQFEIEPLLKDDIVQGQTLGDQRKIGKQQSALFRGRLEGTVEEQEFLQSALRNGWSGFWLYAIWKTRFTSPIRDEWNRFLKAHKAMVAIVNDSRVAGSLQWTKGTPVTSSRHCTQPKLVERYIS